VTTSPPILIIGAGVLGLCTAVMLSRRGHEVVVVDPGEPNASSVAAGMIAPAMEAAIDDLGPQAATLLRGGRDHWPAFAEATGVRLARRPAEWRGELAEAIAERLRALGFEARRDNDRVITQEDWQVEPSQALAALRSALGAAVVRGRVERVAPDEAGWTASVDGGSLGASAVILATGAAAAIEGLPELTRRLIDSIQPIRGQIGVTATTLAPHVTRGPGAYVAPMAKGAVIGATMEVGRRDTTPDPETGRTLIEAAWRVLGRAPEALDIEWQAGVRGASPDGLPMAGAAPDGSDLYVALAPRRNGWLLGPLVGEVVADAVEGRLPSPEARALDPRRF
jgi:glycine oxidase